MSLKYTFHSTHRNPAIFWVDDKLIFGPCHNGEPHSLPIAIGRCQLSDQKSCKEGGNKRQRKIFSKRVYDRHSHQPNDCNMVAKAWGHDKCMTGVQLTQRIHKDWSFLLNKSIYQIATLMRTWEFCSEGTLPPGNVPPTSSSELGSGNASASVNCSLRACEPYEGTKLERPVMDWLKSLHNNLHINLWMSQMLL